jgi:hypothetical protein
MVHLMETRGLAAGAVQPDRLRPLEWRDVPVQQQRAGQGLPMLPLQLRPPVWLEQAATTAVQVVQLRARLQVRVMLLWQQQLAGALRPVQALPLTLEGTATLLPLQLLQPQHSCMQWQSVPRWAL